jgi:uncharacterized RDD family membrane protein YckC
MVYEAMMLFAVIFAATGLFLALSRQSGAIYIQRGLSAWVFFVAGIYFTWFWSHGGQTLAMKTWRIRLVTTDGQSLNMRRAAGRYLLAWLWVLPGLILASTLGAQAWMLILVPFANAALWALAIYFDPERQFLHDRLCGTRLINVMAASSKTTST